MLSPKSYDRINGKAAVDDLIEARLAQHELGEARKKTKADILGKVASDANIVTVDGAHQATVETQAITGEHPAVARLEAITSEIPVITPQDNTGEHPA